MSKLVLIVVVLIVAYMLWRTARARDRRDNDRARPETARTPAVPEDMVRCETCALHLPRDNALPGPDGRFYCCAEHRGLAKP